MYLIPQAVGGNLIDRLFNDLADHLPQRCDVMRNLYMPILLALSLYHTVCHAVCHCVMLCVIVLCNDLCYCILGVMLCCGQCRLVM